ncbi:MAG: MlaD family protein [Saprospiraceae bacterium]|nr:MlaD family protein [Saprospiraceae bacterium]MDW8485248.1 MlaD family protein [Saprospiraceae bacterium]
MLKISRETRIGLLAIVAIAIFIWGFQYLKGINLLTLSQTFYIRYNNVEQLRPSSPVFLSGYQVGTVKDITVDRQDGRSIIVAIDVERRIRLHKNTVATIISSSLMGGKAVSLEVPGPCFDGDCASSGDTLRGRLKGFLETLIGNPRDIDAYTERVRAGLKVLYDSLANPENPQGIGRTLVALEGTLQNLERLTANLNGLLVDNRSNLSTAMLNLQGLSQTLSNNSKTIDAILKNFYYFTDSLNRANLGNRLAMASDSLTLALSSLRITLDTARRTLGRFNTLLDDPNNSLNRLLRDSISLDELTFTLRQVRYLAQDLRLHPERYGKVKLRIFGKDKRPPYEIPYDDPVYRGTVDSLERELTRRGRQ